jgi:hypothetical protein
MDNVIAEYQKWKQQGHSLRTQARQAMEERFRDLLTEAAHVAQEYQNDFGVALKPPPSITAFQSEEDAFPSCPTGRQDAGENRQSENRTSRKAPGADTRKTGRRKIRRQADPQSRRQDLRDRRRHSSGRSGRLILGRRRSARRSGVT